MKFTVEREENNSLSFMDIKIFCDSEKFHTSVYTKHTFSGVTNNFESLFSLLYKYNLVSWLHRVFMISSSYRTLHSKILKLRQIFGNYGYPKMVA